MVEHEIYYMTTAQMIGCFWRTYSSETTFRDYWFNVSKNGNFTVYEQCSLNSYPDVVESLTYDGFLDAVIEDDATVCFYITEKGQKYLEKIQLQFCQLK